jgi:hypothetical protein
VIQAGDELLMFADKDELARIEATLSLKSAPAEPAISQDAAQGIDHTSRVNGCRS